ncbi:glycosyltransferase [Cohnella endophytica]|uniref:Glycosyltransferase n=1 Tax=Cohnella endophytica TaxID=2419778 RepID=A0A494XI56_9BACL|nr:glycosyltransferase family A protein [Cohnella endophytica]RKP47233.1 glycosyltransferase [Cohnella endophytica]
MQTKSPLFSIILPTRNRSFVVEKAIQSVINQTFTDWELIIVDNDTDDKTFKVARKYIGGKVKYVRTGNLPMHTNWQTGLQETSGTFITVLQDKAQYAPYALDVIQRQVSTNPENHVFVWGFIANASAFPESIPSNLHTYSFSSNEVLQMFINENHGRINPILPKMIFSCCHRSILNHCEALQQDLFQPLTPDYTSMFAQLSYFNRLEYIDAPLVHFNEEFSSGKMFRRKMLESDVAQDFTRLSLNGRKENLYADTDTSIESLYNLMMGDFNRIKSRFGGNLLSFEGNKLSVFKEACEQIHEMELHGVNAEPEREQLQQELGRYPIFIRQMITDYEASISVGRYQAQMDLSSAFLVEMLRAMLRNGKKVAFWGAGLTAEYFLSQLKDSPHAISYIVDINSNRKDKQLLGTPITSPANLLKETVDVIFISTVAKWHREVMEQISEMNINVKVLSPLRVADFIQLS